MRVLLFGSTGMLGTSIKEICDEHSIDCVTTHHSEVDITNKTVLLHVLGKYHPVDVVVNSAVRMGIDPCEIHPKEAFDINTVAVANLAYICDQVDAVLIQPSTHAVFDGTKDDYYTEDDHPNPLQIYGITKYASEMCARMCNKHYIIRFPTMFGHRRNNALGFTDKLFGWLQDGRHLRIADDKIDSPTYANDAARTVISLIENRAPYGLYHVANDGMVSLYDFAVKVNEILGTSNLIDRAKDSEFLSLAPKPLKIALKSIKIDSLRSWEEALAEYLGEEYGCIS